jgi:hypothetical protein
MARIEEREGVLYCVEEDGSEWEYSPSAQPEQQPDKITELEAENTSLKLALAELAETQEADKLATQLALAELAELVAGGE